MSNNNTLTVTISYEDRDDLLIKDIMDNFSSGAQEGCARVYAVSREDLFEKIEAIEEILDDWDSTSSDKCYMIKEVLR